MNTILKILRYALYLIRHQHFVRIACWREGLWWRGLIHDWHKWLPWEFFPYAAFFGSRKVRDKTGYYKPTDTGDERFERAWLHHVHLADHHWQHWCLATEGEPKLYPMPRAAILEMICDWEGAGRAQKTTTSVYTWYEANRDKMRLDPGTEARLRIMLAEERWMGPRGTAGI